MLRRPTVLVPLLVPVAILASTAEAAVGPDRVEDVRLRTRVMVVDGARTSGRATLTGHIDVVVTCVGSAVRSSDSCGRQYRVGAVDVVRRPASGRPRTERTRPRAVVVSDASRRARLRIPVGPVRCRGVDDGFTLAFSFRLTEVGSGAPAATYTPEAPGFGCTTTVRRSTRAAALRLARRAFAREAGTAAPASRRAVVVCEDEAAARRTWRCVRRVPDGSDPRGPARCSRVTVRRVSPNRFGRLERSSVVRVSSVSRSFRVPFSNECRPAT